MPLAIIVSYDKLVKVELDIRAVPLFFLHDSASKIGYGTANAFADRRYLPV